MFYQLQIKCKTCSSNYIFTETNWHINDIQKSIKQNIIKKISNKIGRVTFKIIQTCKWNTYICPYVTGIK